jgi:hypothetical protein
VSKMFYGLFNNVQGKTNAADFTRRLSFEVFHYLKHQAVRWPYECYSQVGVPWHAARGLRTVNSYLGEMFTERRQ